MLILLLLLLLMFKKAMLLIDKHMYILLILTIKPYSLYKHNSYICSNNYKMLYDFY